MRVSLVALGGLLFLLTLSVSMFSSDHVSPETLPAEHQNMFQVKQGTSDDHNLMVTEIKTFTRPPLRMMKMNHGRTLRAWSTASSDGHALMVHVEQVRPRKMFVLRGNMLVAPFRARIAWVTPLSFLLCGADGRNISRAMLIDLEHTTITPVPVSRCRAE